MSSGSGTPRPALGDWIDVQRLGGTPSTEDVRELAREIVKIVRDGGSALLTGALGTGKSAVLEAVRDGLAEAGLEVTSAADGPPTAVLVVDDLLRVPADRVTELIARDGSIVAGFESGRHQRAYSTAVLAAAYGSHPLGRDARDVARFHLDPLTDEEMARFLHEHSPAPLDSSAIHAITSLAMGRRSWALDLVEMHGQQQVQVEPCASIKAFLVPGESPLPALQRVRRSLGAVPDDHASAAVALSEIDPLDELGVNALVDAAAVEALTSAGVLVPLGQGPHLTVPGFVAAALRQQSPLDLLDRWRQRIAAGLLAQERLGLPLSRRDATFCVRAWGAGDLVPPELVDVHRDLVVRSVSQLTAFGAPAEIRTAVLACATHGLELPPLARARAMAALGSTHEALVCLDAAPQDDVEARVSVRLVQHVLAADLGQDLGSDGPHALDAAGEVVLRLWNRTDPLDDDAQRLRQVAERHPVGLISTLAALLIDLDAVWNGRVPPYSSSLQAPRPLPAGSLPSSSVVSDAAGAALVAQALVLLIAGESDARRAPLLDVADRLADVDHHARWLRHLIATGTEATFGEMRRAAAEWRLFADSVPGLLPARLRHHVERITLALDAVADPTSVPEDLATLRTEIPYRFALYFAGLHGPLQRIRAELEPTPGGLALARLAQAHLDAASERNPARLVRIAQHFETYRMWLPSAYALSDARRIYLGRRAVGKVRECDEALERVRSEIARHAPWREPHADDLAVILTPRELEAARLAARGLTNRDIAERLECGVRTVESHLAQARAKLGAARREDLGRLLSRIDPL